MTEKEQKPEKEQTPKWLQTIQLNSWEAELLISALVLYALFQLPDVLERMSLSSFDRGSKIHDMVGLFQTAIKMLSFGYITHILVRGIWVASVGFSYVFPKGVVEERLRFKGNFKKELTKGENGSLVKMVLRLEELSSMVYGISFLFFSMFVGFGCVMLFLLSLGEALMTVSMDNAFLGTSLAFLLIFFAFLAILVFIDFITNGLFRRWSWSSDWFYYVAITFRVLTLSFLYRRSLLVLISNVKGWKSHLVPILILGFIYGFVEAKGEIKENVRKNYYQTAASGDYMSANYENTRNQDDILITTIQSDIIQESVLKVFMNDLGAFGGIYHFDNLLGATQWDELPSDSASMYLQDRLKVRIDSLPITNIRWFKSQHPTTLAFGFNAFIDIAHLERGQHFLHLGIDTTNMSKIAKGIVDKEDYSLQTISNIYFMYDK